MPGDLLSRPLIEIAQALRDKEVTAQELVEATIDRHERFGEKLHAYSVWAPRSPRARRSVRNHRLPCTTASLG